MKTVKTLLVATALALAAVGGPVRADEQAPAQGAAGMMGGGGMTGPGMMGPGGFHGMMSGMGKAMCGAMASHVDGRLAYAKAELKITPEQEALWNAYAAAARDNAFAMTTRCTTMMVKRSEAISLPDRLDLHEQLMEAQLNAVRAMNKALKPLYAALTDGQKHTADEMFWGPMGMM